MKKLATATLLTTLLAVLLALPAAADEPCDGHLVLLGSGISQHFWTSQSQQSSMLAEVSADAYAYCDGLVSPKMELFGWGNFYVLTDPEPTTVYDAEGNAIDGWTATFECWVCMRIWAALEEKSVQVTMDQAMAAAKSLTGGQVVGVQSPLDNRGAGVDDTPRYRVSMLVEGTVSQVQVDANTGNACLALPITDDEDDDEDRSNVRCAR